MRGRSLLLAAAAISGILASGCGAGGDSMQPPASRATGSSTFTIVWPDASSRLIPAASNSIKIDVKQGTTIVQSQTINRPASTATFTNLPVGTYTDVATAFPQANAQGTADATGSVTVTVLANATTQVSLTMGSTISSITIAPTSPTVAAGLTTQLGATAKDASGNVVLVAPSVLTWSSTDTTKATVDNTGKVTGVAAGTSTIKVVDTESTKSATTLVTVTAAPPTASLVVNPLTGDNGTTFTADASSSSDRQDAASALQVSFNFGDGTVTPFSTTKVATHVYGAANITAGTKTITVTVKNTAGLTSTASKQITLSTPSVSTISPATYTAGSSVTVSIVVTPPAGTASYGATDTVPPGWTVSNISQNPGGSQGTFALGVVRWIFLDNTPRTLSYTATAPTSGTGSVGTQNFSGVASFDGRDVPTVGQRQVTHS